MNALLPLGLVALTILGCSSSESRVDSGAGPRDGSISDSRTSCEGKPCGADCSPAGSDEPFACTAAGECIAQGQPLGCAKNVCVAAGGTCVAVVPGSCDGVTTDATRYDCGSGVGTQCCLPRVPCGDASCDPTSHYCEKPYSAGHDTGPCPGSPDCPAVTAPKCSPLPSSCADAPTCKCLLLERCGGEMSGSCAREGGGFAVQCMGV